MMHGWGWLTPTASLWSDRRLQPTGCARPMSMSTETTWPSGGHEWQEILAGTGRLRVPRRRLPALGSSRHLPVSGQPQSAPSWPSLGGGGRLKSASTTCRGRIRRRTDTRERPTSARSGGVRKVESQSGTSRASPCGDTSRTELAFSWSWQRVCGVNLPYSVMPRSGSQSIDTRRLTSPRQGESCLRTSTPWCSSGRCAFGRLQRRRLSAWAATTSSAPSRSNCC